MSLNVEGGMDVRVWNAADATYPPAAALLCYAPTASVVLNA
jgi:hypothetical protein